MKNTIRRILAAMMAAALIMSGLPLSFAEDLQLPASAPEQLAECAAEMDETAENAVLLETVPVESAEAPETEAAEEEMLPGTEQERAPEAAAETALAEETPISDEAQQEPAAMRSFTRAVSFSTLICSIYVYSFSEFR